MKHKFFDEIDSDWGDLISDIYNNTKYFKPEYEIIDDKKVITKQYKNENINNEIELNLDDGLYAICDGAFSDCTNLVGDLNIPDYVEYIGNSAFEYCSGFTSLKLSNSLKKIGDYTFDGCTGFTGELVIPESVEYIGSSAFTNCSGFTGDLIIPKFVKFIDSVAFINCSGFNSLKLSKNLKTIKEWAFDGCTSFTGELVIPESVEYIGYNVFQKCKFSKIYVPKKHIDKYDSGWNGYCNAEIILY